MTDYAVCPACGAAFSGSVCNACGAVIATAPAKAVATSESHDNRFWRRFLIASVPAAVLALFVESTLYGYILYLGVYLTYCAWGEATSSLQRVDSRELSANSQQSQLAANSHS